MPLTPSRGPPISFEKLIGVGTYSRVYVCELANEPCAIKVLSKHDVVASGSIEHVFNEKQILTSVSHPFLVKGLNKKRKFFWQDSDFLYIAMEFVPGGELFHWIRVVGRLRPEHARFYFSETLLALEYLHSVGVAYRDLKPENILLTVSGHIKLTDFGAAKVLHNNVSRTHCGTKEYMSPELVVGHFHDRRTDLWSLGVLLFEMLAGFTPFFDEDPQQLYFNITTCRLSMPSHFQVATRDLIRSLLRVNPDERLGSVSTSLIRSHVWVRNVNFDQLHYSSPPWIPSVDHPTDTQNFVEQMAPHLMRTPIKDSVDVFSGF